MRSLKDVKSLSKMLKRNPQGHCLSYFGAQVVRSASGSVWRLWEDECTMRAASSAEHSGMGL